MMAQAKTYLSDEEKKAWVCFCDKANKSESAMLRDMILTVSAGTQITHEPVMAVSKSGKFTVRLVESESLVLARKARLEGYSSGTAWATAALRASLHKEPVLTNEEIACLRESNRALAAIGRNLNQVARALNIEFRESDKLKLAGILDLIERVELHKVKVSALINKNMQRWGDDE